MLEDGAQPSWRPIRRRAVCQPKKKGLEAKQSDPKIICIITRSMAHQLRLFEYQLRNLHIN